MIPLLMTYKMYMLLASLYDWLLISIHSHLHGCLVTEQYVTDREVTSLKAEGAGPELGILFNESYSSGVMLRAPLG